MTGAVERSKFSMNLTAAEREAAEELRRRAGESSVGNLLRAFIRVEAQKIGLLLVTPETSRALRPGRKSTKAAA